MKKIDVNFKKPPQEQVNSLLEHYQAGRYIDAEKLSLSITQEFPEYQFGWKVLAAVLKQMGKINESLIVSQKSVQLDPQDAEAHSNLGVILKELGRLDEAEASLRQAITLKPHYAEAHYNLGNTLKELGKLDEAEASYIKMITLKPNYAEAHNNLGVTLKELDRFNEAEARYIKAITLKPDYAEAYNNLGNTLKELDRFNEAEASLRQAITLKPDYAEAYLNLCELLEKTNRIDEISIVIRNASRKTLEKKADFLYYEALTEFQKENYKTADELVKKININEVLEKRQPAAMKLQGDLYHYKKDYSAAFETYKSQNKHVKDSLEYKRLDVEKYFIQQKEAVVQIKQLQEDSLYKSVIKPRWIQPTFLIGFPRSGTTLLDTILRTHSKIDVLEELPMLTKMKASLGFVPTISMIENMDNTEVEIASGFYLEEMKKHIEVGKNQIIIDKLPLNILELPLINQIFPEASFILALRHPLDCILSCWMQNFKLNHAMANMVELKRIVDFYDTAMSVLKFSKERYSLDIHRIRYEDLVLDFEENVTNLLTFLGLEWEEELRNYQKTALTREKINTPSHSQVIKPIYKTASYRWKNYEKYLNPFKRQLEPWLRDYGY
jgi:Flp pilus assembly protein TadD